MEITKWSLMKKRYDYLDILIHGMPSPGSMHGVRLVQTGQRSPVGSGIQSVEGSEPLWGSSPVQSVVALSNAVTAMRRLTRGAADV